MTSVSQFTGSRFKIEKALSVLNVSGIQTGLFAVNTWVVDVHYSLRAITRALLVGSQSVSVVCLSVCLLLLYTSDSVSF